MTMTIDLTPELESELRRLAHELGRDVDSIVAEAIRQYVVASAITDVTPEEVAQTQELLITELKLEDWGEEMPEKL